MLIDRTPIVVLAAAIASPVISAASEEPGAWVGLQVEVAGRAAPLYTAPHGGRYYVEARKGRPYELRLRNRTGERIAVEVNVDGLNVISGERDRSGADSMYVLDPYESTDIRGWRTSVDEVRRFTFVDEAASYASRSDKANGKMGWIEIAVYRERRHAYSEKRRFRPYEEQSAPEPDGMPSQAPEARNGARDGAGPAPEAAPRSYPGTGWGDRIHDRVEWVDFRAEATPVERLTVRYEYRPALHALGVLPKRDRLEERERGEYGFAAPPRR